jgi:hypothetical protein
MHLTSALALRAWRRLPSLLCRGFPNPLLAQRLVPADLEVGDTAGLETCATKKASG